MEWTLPGTVLICNREDAADVESMFQSMFLGGGMVLSQVASITGLEPYAVQNWVKRGFLPPPERKKYSMRQLCRIISINMLKHTLPMERICSLLSYINGHLDDESDDIIDDSQLYFMFVRLASQLRQVHDQNVWDALLEKELESYVEPVPGAKARVMAVLRIMVTAWTSARLRQAAEQMLTSLEP